MSERRDTVLFCLCLLLFLFFVLPSVGMATEGGGYLAGYENQDPTPNGTTGVSWWSTIAYVASLVVVFLFVAGLAYYASKFLGGRFGRAASGGGGRVLEHLPLGPGRSACVVELAGRLLILGVTEHSITLLGEIDDAAEAEQLLKRSLEEPAAPFSGAGGFERQFGSLDQLAKRIPAIFKNDAFRK